MPPQWNQRAPSAPKIVSQSTSPGRSCDTAVWPRSEQPTAPRTPKPRSVKLRPLRAVAADAVVGHPAQVALVDAAAQDELLDETADGVVGERADERRAQAEAAPQAARHVVLAAALPDLEGARGRDPALAGIEAQHDLAEGHEVPAAVAGVAKLEDAHGLPPRAATVGRARAAISRASRGEPA